MGCGQSKIHLYPRKSKSKANGKKGGHADSDAETDEDEGHIEDTEKYQNRDREKNEESDDQSNKGSQESDDDVAVSLLRAKNLSLLQSQEISTSQQNFFRMLDKKIDEGPDYDSASETEIALEEARLNALVQHWESASLTASICSSASRSLQTTPVRQAAPAAKHMTLPRGAMLQQSAVVQQVFNADFLPHGTVPPQSSQLPAGPLKLLQQNPNQQMVISHMNTKMLHQMAVGPQLPMGMSPADIQVSAGTTTANTSNALALMQAPSPNQSQQYVNMLTLPAGSAQLMGKPPNVSPKRMVDPRLLMNPNPLAQQMQPSMQSQFITASAISPVPPPPSFVNGGRSPQPPGIGMQMPMQMAYFGQPTAQQSMQVTSQHEQQQLPPPQCQNQSQPYYGDIIHSIQAPPAEYRFPPAISVQRLAPQVQRQLRETQELIKDSCPQLYAAGYGSPGPPIRNQARNPTRRPTLETQFSQELS